MPRILIITKFRFIGDTLLAIPIFRAVRQNWSDAHITLLTGHNANVLLQNNPHLDEIIEFDPRGADRGTLQFLRLVMKLRRGRYDFCLTLNRSFHSALIPALAGIATRAGFSSEGRSCLLNRRVAYDHDKSEIDCYFDVLRAIAPHVPTETGLELWLSHNEREQADSRLTHALGQSRSSCYLIGIQPGASLPEKRWDAGDFARVAAELVHDNAATRIILIGGPDERSAAECMLAQCSPNVRERIVDFVGHTDLRGSLALVACLHLFLGNDTAILHSANALGVPTVALFGPTNPRKWGAQGGSHRILQAADGLMSSIETRNVIENMRALRDIVTQEDAPLTPSAGSV